MTTSDLGRRGIPDFSHYAGQCSPSCRSAACSCEHCVHDHAISMADQSRTSCTTGCGCREFADSGLSVQARAITDAVLEAVGIPYGASVGDGERYNELLAERVMHLTVALKSITDLPPLDLGWKLGYLRERLATCPVDYRTDYAEVLAGLRASRADLRGSELAQRMTGKGENR